MELLKCLKCSGPLVLEVSEITSHNITADGRFFVDSSAFGHSCRVEERLLCKQCGNELFEGKDWKRDEALNIVLL